MARVSRKRRLRRVPSERARPAETRPLFGKPPPGKRLVRLVMTLLFYIAAVVLIVHGTPQVMVRRGERAPRDYKARVDFEVEDLEATRQRQRDRAAQAHRVFRNNPDVLRSVQRDVVRFLYDVVEQAGTPSLLADGETLWRITPEQMALLRKHLTLRRLERLEDCLNEAFAKAAERGVWAASTLENEKRNGRFMVDLYDVRSGTTNPVSIQSILVLGQGVRDHFVEFLNPFFAPDDPEGFREALLAVVTAQVPVTLTLDPGLTAEAEALARKTIAPVMKRIRPGYRIAGRGETVTEQMLRELRREEEIYSRRHPPSLAARFTRTGGVALAVALLFLTAGAYFARFRTDIIRSNTLYFRVGAVCLLTLTAAKVVLATGTSPYLIPLSFAAIVLTIACGAGLALGMVTLVAVLLWMMMGMRFEVPAVLLIGSATGIVLLENPRRRTDVVKVGFFIGLAGALAAWGVGLAAAEITREAVLGVLHRSVAAFANGLGVGLLMTALMPYVERTFGVVTDMILQEWSDQNQPLLRKLVLEAPGTYHHSIIVGTLAEAAAEAIGANPMLARAASFLHDVGKLSRPDYFVENTGDNPGSKHDGLSPQLSALIITSHTKDGVEIAKQYGVPRPIRDIIEQHHGTTLVEYFHSRALEQSPDSTSVSADSFRYRGPLPQTREAGLVLIADAVESASRVLSNPTPARVADLVRQIVRRRLLDGQLDESGLTLTEVKRAEESLIRTLTAILHHRIEYPQ